MNTPEGARKSAATQTAKYGGKPYWQDKGAKGGAASSSRPMRDRPGYAAELANKRWAKARALKEAQANVSNKPNV